MRYAFNASRRVGDFRPAPAALRRPRRQRRRDVEAGERAGGIDDAGRLRQHQVAQFLEMRGLGGERMIASLHDARRLLMQFRRVEAHHPGEGLAMGETRIGGHQGVGMPRCHLDMIAEDIIVTDLEAGNAGAVPIAAFEQRDRPPPVARDPAQLVQCRVEAFRDETASRLVGIADEIQSGKTQEADAIRTAKTLMDQATKAAN